MHGRSASQRPDDRQQLGIMGLCMLCFHFSPCDGKPMTYTICRVHVTAERIWSVLNFLLLGETSGKENN